MTVFAKPVTTKFPIIQALRGIAALGVCWVHFTQSSALFPTWSLISLSGRYGWLGVEAFFVISGFIVTYSLFRGGYKINSFFIFLWKRIVRVDPPYIIAIAIAVCAALLAARAPSFAGAQPHFSAAQIAFHLGYLIPFVQARGYDWVNGSFWTLGIEFQFYLAIALLFPLIVAHNQRIRLSIYFVLCLTSVCFPVSLFLPTFLPLFLFGIAGMLKKVEVSTTWEFWLTIGIATACCLARLDVPYAAAGLVTLACIMHLNRAPVALLVLGDMSYSLYVIHQPIGGKIVNFGGRFLSYPAAIVLPFAALLIVLIVAYAMYIFIELPAKRWASRWRYKRVPDRSTLPVCPHVGDAVNL